MSIRQRLLERYGPQVLDPAVDRVDSGSPVTLHLEWRGGLARTVDAALALMRRHVSMRDAHRVMTDVLDHRSARIDVPMVEDTDRLVAELAACNIAAEPVAVPRSARAAVG